MGRGSWGGSASWKGQPTTSKNSYWPLGWDHQIQNIRKLNFVRVWLDLMNIKGLSFHKHWHHLWGNSLNILNSSPVRKKKLEIVKLDAVKKFGKNTVICVPHLKRKEMWCHSPQLDYKLMTQFSLRLMWSQNSCLKIQPFNPSCIILSVQSQILDNKNEFFIKKFDYTLYILYIIINILHVLIWLF